MSSIPRQLIENRIPIGAGEWRSVTVAYLHELYDEIAAQRDELEACRQVLAELGYDWNQSRRPDAPAIADEGRRRRRGIPRWARWQR